MPIVSIKRLTGGQVPVIYYSMDSLRKMLQLSKAGWRLEICPIGSNCGFGFGRARLTWTMQRDDLNAVLDGNPLPIEQEIPLLGLEPDAVEFAAAVDEMFARVFPEFPYDDLPPDSPFREL